MFSKFIYSLGLICSGVLLNACDFGFETDETIYRCGKLSVHAAFRGADNLTLGIMGEYVPMTVTESGVFEGTTNNGGGVVFTLDGDKTALALDMDAKNSFKVCECREIIADADQDFVSFKAIGHEPEWYFTFNNMIFGFRMPGGQESIVVPADEFKVPKMVRNKMKMRITKNDETIDIKIQKKVCTDNMSGQFFAYTVSVTYNGMEYNGCGLSLSDPKQSLLPI